MTEFLEVVLSKKCTIINLARNVAFLHFRLQMILHFMLLRILQIDLPLPTSLYNFVSLFGQGGSQ